MILDWGVNKELANEGAKDTPIVDESGLGIDVYVLDTGVRITHRDFNHPGLGRATHYRKTYTDDGFEDTSQKGHGTLVVDTVIANAPNVNIINVKVAGPGSSIQRVIDAIRDVTADHTEKKKQNIKGWKGSIMNMSFTLVNERHFENAIRLAIKAGITVVAGAGNNGERRFSYPCGYQDVICVGSVDSSYKRSKFSNYGPAITLFAPGERINGPSNIHDLVRSTQSGTSFAAPHVSAIGAIFTSYEQLRNDVATVRKRLVQNWQKDLLSDAQSNILANTGLNNQNRDKRHPYDGPDSRELIGIYDGELKGGEQIYTIEDAKDPVPANVPLEEMPHFELDPLVLGPTGPEIGAPVRP